MLAKEIMSSPAITVTEDTSLQDAARLMSEHRVGGLPVVDASGKAVGFITDSDFAAKESGVPFSLMMAPKVLGEWLGNEGVERVYRLAREKKVTDVMSAPVVRVAETDTVETVLRKLMEHDINRVVVARDGVPVGIVSRHDLMRIMLQGPPGG